MYEHEIRLIKLEEKIKESGKSPAQQIQEPQGTKFEFQVLQTVIPADFLHRDLGEGFDPSTIKLLYSVSDQE